MPVIFAQSIGEYISLSSLKSGIEELTYSATTWLESLSTTTWIIVAVVLVGLVMLKRR